MKAKYYFFSITSIIFCGIGLTHNIINFNKNAICGWGLAFLLLILKYKNDFMRRR
ncbi:MAG: hypothetical protein ACFFDN_04995 [Candidatus Hodarchaeota archaeon]